MRIRSGVQNGVTYLVVAGVGIAATAASGQYFGPFCASFGIVLCVPAWMLTHRLMAWLNLLVSRRTRDRRWLCAPEGRRWLTTAEGRNWRREQARAKGLHAAPH